MAGSHHTGRRPNRITSIGRRDARAIADARRVSEADLRMAIYVRPDGLGIHIVKNPCNDETYKVADATAGATFSAGAAVVLGSFSGNPGEVILGRPPAGFGGASGYSVNKVNVGYGTGTSTDTELDEGERVYPYLFSYSPATGRISIAGLIVTGPVESPVEVGGAIFSGGDAATPRSYYQLGEELIRFPGETPMGFASDLQNGDMVIWLSTPSGFSTVDMRVVRVSSSGSIGAETSPLEVIDSGNISYFIHGGGSVFSVEGREPPIPPVAIPFQNNQRIVKRNKNTLAIEATYDFPSVTPFDGRAARVQVVRGIYRESDGGVVAMFNNVTATLDSEVWSRKFTSSLSVSGADVLFDSSSYDPTGSSLSANPFVRHSATGQVFAMIEESEQIRVIDMSRSGVIADDEALVPNAAGGVYSNPLLLATGSVRFAVASRRGYNEIIEGVLYSVINDGIVTLP